MRLYGLIVSLLLWSAPLMAQQPSRSDLEKRRQSIIEEIKETQAQLEATKNDKKATLSQLQALQAKLAARQRLIGNINQELSHLDDDIKHSSNEVVSLRNELANLQERYAQSVRYAYANRSSYNALAFLFSSGDFNDAVRRLKYLKKYRTFRKGQVEEIRLTQNKIERKIDVLNNVKTQKSLLLTAEEQQKIALQTERNQTQAVIQELKGRESELAADIERKRKNARQLDKAISDAIRREIEIARKKAEEEERKRREDEAKKAAALAAAEAAKNGGVNLATGSGSRFNVPAPPSGTGNKPATGTANKPATTTAKSNTPAANETPVASTVDRTARPSKPRPSYTPMETPDIKQLSLNFESNRGRLPWPVERGVVVDEFGKHRHAIATKVEIENNGIDIQTSAGAKARAIFDGVVTTIIPMPGMGQTVLIKHGQYFSVYARLSSVLVKVGDNVSTKQPVGVVSNNEDGVAVMNFQIWRNGDKMNPSAWIAPM